MHNEGHTTFIVSGALRAKRSGTTGHKRDRALARVTCLPATALCLSCSASTHVRPRDLFARAASVV